MPAVLAHESAVTAVYAFARHPDDFEAMIRFVIGLGGDTDRIGAMAGGIFGAARGAARLPEELIARLEARDEFARLAGQLHEAERGR